MKKILLTLTIIMSLASLTSCGKDKNGLDETMDEIHHEADEVKDHLEN